jgi:DNA ligase-4
MIVKLFQKMSSLRGVKKSHYLREFLKIIFKSSREPPFIYSLLRILLPADDRDRGNYGLKEKGLAKVIADCLGLQKSDFDRLYHYKNPNFHQTGFAIGDFSLCVFEVAQKFCK